MCLPDILFPVFMFAFIFYCHSFSPCWPLLAGRQNFSFSHRRFEFTCSSPWFSITRSSSFSVIHVSVNIKNNAEKDTTITKFSRMGRLPHFLGYGAPSTRGAWSSAINQEIQRPKTQPCGTPVTESLLDEIIACQVVLSAYGLRDITKTIPLFTKPVIP